MEQAHPAGQTTSYRYICLSIHIFIRLRRMPRRSRMSQRSQISQISWRCRMSQRSRISRSSRLYRRSRIISRILRVSRKMQFTGYYWQLSKSEMERKGPIMSGHILITYLCQEKGNKNNRSNHIILLLKR